MPDFSRYLTALGLVCLLGGCADPGPAPPGQPSVILVDIDTLRADHLGSYGYGRDTSPNLDAFSRESVRFEWVFAQAPNTPPSQASILTSLYPTVHGRIAKLDKMSEAAVTLAEALQASGYRTAAFVDGGLMAAGFGMEQGFELYDDEAGHLHKIGPKVASWIDQHVRGPTTAGQPFLLLIHSYDVHSPYEVTPPRFRDYFLGGLTERPPDSFTQAVSKRMAEVWGARNLRPRPQLDAAQLSYAKALYDGGIRHVDDWFGRFVEQLEARRLLDTSIVIVISDHGDAFQEHQDLFHEQINASVTRVPMIIRFPGGAHAGVQSQVVETLDLMPTILEALDEPTPPGLQGRSLMPLLEAGILAPRPAITESPFRGRRLGIATERYRLLHTQRTGQRELYAYRSDPLESRDLAASQPEEADRLHGALERWQKRVEAMSLSTEAAGPLDAETIEQLRALGYLD